MKKGTKIGLGIAGAAALVTAGAVMAKRYIEKNALFEDDYVEDDDPEFYGEYDVLSERDFTDNGEDEELIKKESIKKPAVSKVAPKKTDAVKKNNNATKAKKETTPKVSTAAAANS